MSETLIQAENVGKKFCRNLQKSLLYGLKDSAKNLLGRDTYAGLRAEEFWANQDISFELKRGQSLGLIGRNGAGKTTLLKMLSGLIKPDVGHITMRGRVNALIALGAGFNPVLTARENIFVNASILGFSQEETKAKLDEIIDFSGIEEFIDTPVRSFSSGMQVRLGFAIASCVRPDILLVDEVLAVGDADFRLRCYDRINEILKTGCAVILVSHNLTDIVNVCTKGLWLEKGKPVLLDDASTCIARYSGSSGSNSMTLEWDSGAKNYSCESLSLTALSISPREGYSEITIESGGIVTVEFDCHKTKMSLDVTLEVTATDGVIVFHTGELITPNRDSKLGHYKVSLELPSNFLNSGKYDLSLIIGESQQTALVSAPNIIEFHVGASPRGIRLDRLPGVTAPVLPWTLEHSESSTNLPSSP